MMEMLTNTAHIINYSNEFHTTDEDNFDSIIIRQMMAALTSRPNDDFDMDGDVIMRDLEI